MADDFGFTAELEKNPLARVEALKSELEEANTKCFILNNREASSILKKPFKLFEKYKSGFCTEYLTPAWAAKCTTFLK